MSQTKKSCVVSEFQKEVSFEERTKESQRVLERYVDRIPCIIEVKKNDKNLKQIDKKKFLLPNDLTVGQLIWVLRKRMRLSPETGIFLLFNNTMVPASSLVKQIYAEHKDLDNFVYATLSSESVFGA